MSHVEIHSNEQEEPNEHNIEPKLEDMQLSDVDPDEAKHTPSTSEIEDPDHNNLAVNLNVDNPQN